MQPAPALSTLSLKSKLILSYLLVILGTVVVLSFAVYWAVTNYIANQQMRQLQQDAMRQALNLERNYIENNGDWAQVESHMNPVNTVLVVISANQNQPPICVTDPVVASSNCSNSLVMDGLKGAWQGNKTSVEDFQLSTSSGNYPAFAIAVPLQSNGSGNVFGALFMVEPEYPIDSNLLGQIDGSIVLAGLLVAFLALLCSYLFVSRFIRPLERLTVAVEQVKRGQYAQRVVISDSSHDEIGRLSQTFNEMANTIESDMNELRNQDQMRRELIANIAHDLATPLTSIQGLSEALADDVISDPTARHETAQRIGREIQRLRRLVADVRQMTLLEARRIPLDLAPLDLRSLVDETLFVIEPECTQSSIHLHNSIASGVPSVMADSDRIIQVLLNLLDNARRHTPSDGHISVHALSGRGYVQVVVSDSGIGIDPKDLPHIFERFYRADRSRATTTGGSGLGLSIVKAIINAHGGNIWAESTPGRGTRIFFTLPLAQRRPPEPDPVLASASRR